MTTFQHLIILVICAATARCAFAEGAAFGPTAHTNTSPNKLWEIRSKPNKEHEGNYNLILRDRRTGAERDIFSGDRWCEVLWSANDSQIAITDWRGSDDSVILLQTTAQKSPAKELPDNAARAFLPKGELVGHCYWEALKWEADGRLRIRAFGHTDEKPLHQFVYEFIFDPAKNSAVLIKKESGPRSRAEQKIWANKEKAWKESPRRTSGLSQ